MSAALQRRTDQMKCIPKGRDPPGQKAAYIIPGDPCIETYRAATFKEFPVRVDVLSIATNGFYFTGYKDRVKCFSCGMAVEKWNKDEEIDFSKWHDSTCDFLNGSDESNVPMRRVLLRKSNRQQRTGLSHQFTADVLSYSYHSPRPLPAGEVLFSDITNDIDVRHNEQSSAPGANNRNDQTASASVNDNNEDAELQQRRELFPCQHPINPHMRSSDVRFQTFIDRSDVWPQHRINATPQEISEAGFFYLGERDRVKCWYCNGGLQNFERNDIGWEEHAKWFPMCEYLLQQKGPEFVHNIVSRYPNLRRPALHNPAHNVTFNGNGITLRSTVPPPNLSESYVEIIDPKKQEEERKKKIDQEMNSSEIVANAKLMGFSEENIRATIKSHYELHNKGFSDCASLINAILLAEREEENNSENSSSTRDENQKLTNKSKLEDLLESKKCRVCHDEDACMVFIPCGHLPCCSKCGAEVKKCPICRSEISQRIRSYIS